ncbi:MAG TPA: hypothetical protein VMV60_10520 [Thermoanaerobaculia bacterium]|nr:hypothetical protein [Thermoanaerobaculia bacterium]
MKEIFLLFFLHSVASRAQEPPRVTLERIVDGRGNRVCDVAKAELKAEGVRRTAWVVRGLVRSDLVLALETVGPASLHEIGFAGRPVLRLATRVPGGRVTATSPASEFRYFDVDLQRKTVRCNLSRLADETDVDLLAAAEEYGLLKQGLENGSAYVPEELPVVALLAAKKPLPHPSPPYRKSVPWTEGGPEADELAAAARAVIAR